jgi:hypothetical protein
VPGCGAVARSWTVGMVKSAKVFSSGGVVVMGIVGVTTLHPRGPGNPELTPPTEIVSPSSEHSSRTVCTNGDPLCTIPMNTTLSHSPREKDSGCQNGWR